MYEVLGMLATAKETIFTVLSRLVVGSNEFNKIVRTQLD